MRMLSTLVLVLATATGCATASKGSAALGQALLPTSEEVKLGNQLAAQVNQEEKILNNDTVQRYVDQVGQRVAKVAPDKRKGIRYQFTVVDDPRQVNAFALPGGHMYVYSGLIAAAGSEAELASVLAHEVGHVNARHAAQSLGAQFGLQTLASLALGQNPGQIQQLGAAIAAQGYLMRNSRDMEREADERGLDYLRRAGYDTSAMPAFFRRLEKLAGSNPSFIQAFFASHPAPGERATTLSKEIQRKRLSGGKKEIVGSFSSIQSQLGSSKSGTTKPKTDGGSTRPKSDGGSRPPAPR